MSYPVSFEVEYAERRSRLTAFFRLLLIIPIAIWLYIYGIIAYIAIIIRSGWRLSSQAISPPAYTTSSLGSSG